jgi:hypothetical protein
VPLIGRANAALARYAGLVAAIPNASVLLSPLATQEAVLSSKISRESALRILRALRTENVLSKIREGAGRRPPILAFPDLLNIAEGKDVL